MILLIEYSKNLIYCTIFLLQDVKKYKTNFYFFLDHDSGNKPKSLVKNTSNNSGLIYLPKLRQKTKKIDYNKELNPYIRKLSTDELIKLREKNLEKLKKNKVATSFETEEIQNQKNTKFYYNELTPNRNINGFNIHNFLSQKKVKMYCEKFIDYDRSSYVHDEEKSFRNYKKAVYTSLKDELE